MRGSARSDAAHANGSAGEELNIVRAFDCVDPMHEEAHFTSETDAVLTEKVLRHFAEYHPDVAEEAVITAKDGMFDDLIWRILDDGHGKL